MSWKSKLGAVAGGLIGGTAGFFMGGPLGAVAGASLGASAGEKKIGGTTKHWDTHWGRKGLLGEGGEMLGLWESGTTRDKKNKAINAIEDLKQNKIERFETGQNLANQNMLANIYNTNTKADGLISGISQGGNLDTDNNRGIQTQRIIRDSVKQANLVFGKDLQNRLQTEDAHEMSMATLDQQQQQIDEA